MSPSMQKYCGLDRDMTLVDCHGSGDTSIHIHFSYIENKIFIVRNYKWNSCNNDWHTRGREFLGFFLSALYESSLAKGAEHSSLSVQKNGAGGRWLYSINGGFSFSICYELFIFVVYNII